MEEKKIYKKADNYYIAMIVTLVSLWLLTDYPVFIWSAGVIFTIYTFSWVFRLYAYSGGGQLKQIELSEVNRNGRDTSDWLSGRGIIVNYTPHADVVENGKVVGHLMWFLVRVEDGFSKKWQTYVKDHFIPITHLKSFGTTTETVVLYNPKKNLEVIFDVDQENWHHKLK